MDKEMVIYVGIMILGLIISSVSQVLLKKAANRHYNTRIKEYLNISVIGAYIMFFLATLFSVFAYRVVPLSLGQVLETISYFLVTFFGVTVFHDKLNKNKIIALLLIVVGILIYAVWG